MNFLPLFFGLQFLLLVSACDSDENTNLCDVDGDGVEGFACGGDDCNDNNNSISPNAGELCDEIDHNCDGWKYKDPVDGLVSYFDGDWDGYGDPATLKPVCELSWQWVTAGDDCDDTNSILHPETVWYLDSDGDGRGTPQSPHETVGCEQVEEGYVSNSQDPDDANPNDTGCWAEITVARDYACVLSIDGVLTCWGVSNGSNEDYGQVTDAPTGAGFVQVTAGYYHACALDSSGQATCWGSNQYGEASPPASAFSSISCGLNVCCGLLDTESDNVACWGRNDKGQTLVPEGRFTQVNAGFAYHVCGIKESGEIVCWGTGDSASEDPDGPIDIPPGSYSDVNIGHYVTCAVQEDGEGECWGRNTAGQTNVPAGEWHMIRAGTVHTCGLKTNGEIACWGNDRYDRSAAPSNLMWQIDVNQNHGCGLGLDGFVHCWGNDAYDMLTTQPSCD